MLNKTKGIVFKTYKYSETSIIAKIYTEQYGLQSFLVNSVRSKKSKFKSSLFQQLSLVDLVAYQKPTNNLQRIKEICNTITYKSIPFDIAKSSIALFLTEILYKSLHEGDPNKQLYIFISNSLIELDNTQKLNPNFHILFLIQLTRHLGFYPNGQYSDVNPFFDSKEGIFVPIEPNHPYYFNRLASKYLSKFLTSSLSSLGEIEIKKDIRNILVEKMIEYYRLHITDFKEIKSYKVLTEVFNN